MQLWKQRLNENIETNTKTSLTYQHRADRLAFIQRSICMANKLITLLTLPHTKYTREQCGCGCVCAYTKMSFSFFASLHRHVHQIVTISSGLDLFHRSFRTQLHC